ncbi:hypothetical protein K1T71_008417 [Dendrolimus kikuchii]|uniref:Uncharacterized protein n=1 Tax=Dendrolimus kikuchii TaxID=765133 RepID=A0ACC1CX75_9NEOP|nr:hypothetical protein K1T71_008417 [Dendrolimus kikuchii]
MPYPILNETFLVGTVFPCDNIYDDIFKYKYKAVWRQTFTGCQILQILQEIYRFKFGFILRQPEYASFYRTFYSKPFTRPSWNCLYGMAFLATVLFCLIKRCEKRLISGGMESSFSYEMLMVVGGYCQHIPPIYGTMYARRIAYFVFFIFSFLIYSFYTSNLLSHLVNDKDRGFNLEFLAASDIECVMVDTIKLSIMSSHQKNLSIVEKKLLNMRSVSAIEGLEGVKAGTTALLSDYMTLLPYIQRTLSNEDLCKIIQVDLFSNVKKYFFTSKKFPYKDKFKIGILRAKEAGLLRRVVFYDVFTPVDCDQSHFQTHLLQIFTPLTILACTHVACVIILLIERYHYKRNKVLPYTE